VSPLLLASLVVLHGTLLDGTGGSPLRDARIVIEDGRITAIGESAGYRPRLDDEVLDARGKWIVPGYIDVHVHLFDSGSLYTSPDDYDLNRLVPHEEERGRIESKIDETLARFLCSGVTTVASLGGPRWELDVSRRSVAPRVVSAGPFLAGFPVGDVTLWTREDPVLVPIASPQEARERAREVASAGAGILKAGYVAVAGPGLDVFLPVLHALVEEARARGLPVAVHAEELETAKAAARAGVDVLAHTVVDRPVDEEFLALAKRSGLVAVTGAAHFGSYSDVLRERVELLDVEKRCGDPDVISTWSDLSRIPESERPPIPSSIAWGSSPAGREILIGNLSRMHRAGIPIAVGTNGGNVGTLQGPSFHRELHALVEAGMPLEDVLVAATRNGARALGLAGERGTIEVGKAADLVILDESPLQSVEAFAAIDRVLVGGRDVSSKRRTPAEPMSYRGALWLEREEREDEERPDLVLGAMALEPGHVVADIGAGRLRPASASLAEARRAEAGSGFYTRRLAKLVAPGGKVYAVDVQPEMLQLLEELAREAGVTGIETVVGAPDDPRLPRASVDWVLLADVYHEVAEPEAMLARIRQSLAPGGKVALVEYRVEDGSGDHIKADHAMSVRQVLAEWRPAGFELVALHELLPTQHLFVFRGAGDGPPEEALPVLDLHLAIEGNLVEAEARGSSEGDVRVRIRRRGETPLVVTLEAGTSFGAMFARRDAWVLLDDADWKSWTVRAVRSDFRRDPPKGRDRLELGRSPLRRLFSAIQAGTARSADGSVHYLPRTPEVEGAAVWIAIHDADYGELFSHIGTRRIAAPYAAGFALWFCDLAGIDVTSRRIWKDAPAIFGEVRDPGLREWYEGKREK
jgi:imidazolonepropionase-like amidohydrolase/precorrin-6B methylase 2